MLLTLLSYSIMSLSKLILPVVAGVMSGMILQALGERGIHALYPMPISFGMSGKEAVIVFYSQVSFTFYLLMLLNIAVFSSVSGMVSTLVLAKPSVVPAIIVGVIISLGEVYSLAKIDGNPTSFAILCVAIHLPFAYTGYLIANKYFHKHLIIGSK